MDWLDITIILLIAFCVGTIYAAIVSFQSNLESCNNLGYEYFKDSSSDSELVCCHNANNLIYGKWA